MATPPRILYADDDPDSRELVRQVLEEAGMTPLIVGDGTQALVTWRQAQVALIILDINMPMLDGFEACRYIRQVSDIPIMMLTVREDEQDIVRGFEAGADDYIVKPFRPKELVARILAILQRTARPTGLAGSRLVFGDLELDVTAQRATRRGQTLPVTALEFQLLRYLMQRVGVAVSKEDLFRDVWGYTLPAGGMNLIEVAIRRLREKVEDAPSQPRYIQTVRGVGYRFGD